MSWGPSCMKKTNVCKGTERESEDICSNTLTSFYVALGMLNITKTQVYFYRLSKNLQCLQWISFFCTKINPSISSSSMNYLKCICNYWHAKSMTVTVYYTWQVKRSTLNQFTITYWLSIWLLNTILELCKYELT